MKKKILIFLMTITFISTCFSQDQTLLPDKLKDSGSVDMVELRVKLKMAIDRRQFDQAASYLQEMQPSLMTPQDQEYERILKLFSEIDQEQDHYDSMFKKDSSMPEDVKKTVRRLIREGKNCLLIGQKSIAKDLFSQVLYVDKSNYFARKLLEKEWELSPGSYVVQNMEAKYWGESEVSFYSGQFDQAIRVLTVLTYFDPNNALVYERLGSNYYNSGRTKEAIDAWTTAFALNPKHKDLDVYITNAKLFLEEQKKELGILMKKKKKPQLKKKKVADKELVLMGVYVKQTEAYSFAQDVKKQLGVQPIVEEEDNGSWSVKIPKSAAHQNNNQKIIKERDK